MVKSSKGSARFLYRRFSWRAENSIGPTNVIVQTACSLTRKSTRRSYSRMRHDLLDRVDDFVGPPQGDLIADLIEIPHEWRAFTTIPRTATLIFCKLRKTFSISRVITNAGRCSITLTRRPVPTLVASGQVAKRVVKGVRQLAFELVIEFVDALPGRSQAQATTHDLNAQVILFVDHDAKRSSKSITTERSPSPSAISRLINCRSTRN